MYDKLHLIIVKNIIEISITKTISKLLEKITINCICRKYLHVHANVMYRYL